ncbi:MAG TPA: HlyD family efflux transporter periplasmic adaptor subunit, partial [Marmoricola sp.]|nr:HlyD family efflux transporter periplasmic adaptor subunit [Marmoricola sp.]
ASVDAAEASVVSAQVARDQMVLRAPIAGKVVNVGVAVGGTASTSSAAITLVGNGANTVVLSVPLAQIPEIKVGEKARVVISGASAAVDGVVSNVGIIATTGTSGTTTYAVTVSLSEAATALQGIGASVTIVTGSAANAVTVPVSALTKVGTRTVVNTYNGGKVTETPVTVGILGSTTASITSGLKAGQQIALADLGASVPTSSTSNGTRGLTGFGGGTFSGGGTGGPPSGGGFARRG